MVRKWDQLHQTEQQEYIDKARFLIEKNYAETTDAEALAEKIYTKTVVDRAEE